MKASTIVCIAIACFASTGCSGSAPPTGGGGTGGTAPTDPTACASPPITQDLWACNQPTRCNAFNMRTDGTLYSGAATAPTVADVQCVLRALRDGTPGKYEFGLDVPPMPGLTIDGYRLNVLPNGSVLESVAHYRDLARTEYDFRYVRPKTDGSLDACAEETNPAALRACLLSWQGAAASGCPMCPGR